MMRLSQAAEVLKGKIIAADGMPHSTQIGEVLFTGVSSDSRAMAAGDLFVALQGDHFDGAAFVADAARSGAVAALVNAGGYPIPSPIPLILVDDTKLALGSLAAYWRTQFTLPLIAITGSNGKTTVKEMLAGILRYATGGTATAGMDKVLATPGNLNNDIGMPLTLLKLRDTHRYAVIEMGMNHAGEIAYLSRLARPGIAIVNNAGSAHLAGLGSIADVARAKGEIFAGLDSHGCAVINADDAYAPLWRSLVENQAGQRKIIEFGLEHPATITAQYQPHEIGAHIDVHTPCGDFSVQLQVPGAHNVRNALAAIAASVVLNIHHAAIIAGLQNFAGVAGRMQRHKVLHGAQLIDDSYNANPASLSAALKVLTQAQGRKILVLGDMGELGKEAISLHGEMGVEARKAGVDELLALGDLTRHTVREFGAGARHFEDIKALFAALEMKLNAHTTVLVKGSRFMRMERVVQYCSGMNKQDSAAAAH
ncbi:MAG: UDP-N-acetylmuramoyl-tripeptide--D-alanyl-D-alanine ligase [Candidatus Nitrotoga sp.]